MLSTLSGSLIYNHKLVSTKCGAIGSTMLNKNYSDGKEVLSDSGSTVGSIYISKTLKPRVALIPKIHNFKMTNLIDPIVQNIIQLGQNFISLESVIDIACVGH
jgi:hypothetical protein